MYETRAGRSMSAVVSQRIETWQAPARAPHAPRIGLLGTGTVGAAFVARYEALQARGFALPRLAWLANSRGAWDCGRDASIVLRQGRAAGDAKSDEAFAAASEFAPGDVVIDATASDAVAAKHADWLACGVHVVTANKLGNGGTLARAQAIARAQRESGARYGDAATVGAGLPLLRSIRELRAGGDAIEAIEGVLSGSLAWLFSHYDGLRPFSGFVRQAREAGYTEPDPREDLSGADVRRKLLILARAAGHALEERDVEVESLVTPELAALPVCEVDAALPALDAPLRARFQHAYRESARLAFVARFEPGRAHVGVQALAAEHPLAGGAGTDNRVAIFSSRYRERPLLIQGPGAGAEVTTAGLLDDVLRIAQP